MCSPPFIPIRGVDVVPVVFALWDTRIVVPVDTIKQKRTKDLQRSRNLRNDPRCALLVESYSEAWEDLWWVRVHARGADCPPEGLDTARHLLAARFPRYDSEGSIVAALVLDPQTYSGWSASR